jgi:transcriptional regulator with XRE-family HTH domain
MDIGGALRDIRKSIDGRRQQEVSKAIGITQTYLSLVEAGKRVPAQEVVEKLCKAYKVPIAIVVWKAIEPKDVDRSKKEAFGRIKPIVDDLLEGFLINNFK